MRELYESHAQATTIWDFLNGVREHIDRIHHVMGVVKQLQPKSVVDMACNHGLFGFMLKARSIGVEHLIGVDISDEACKAAEFMGYDKVLRQDVTQPMFSAEKSDLALCMEILEHVPEPQVVVENALRIADRALFSTPIESGEVDGEFHVRHVYPWALREWVEKCGGIIEDLTTVGAEFCEKPHWVGWTYCLARSKDAN